MSFTRCRTCLMPNTRPSLYFDETGQCSACTNFFNRPTVDWQAREEQLREIIASAKPGPTGHNVVVPSSGGKDSTYQTLKLIELGARPLVVTATTCYLTPIGRKNIDNLARFATTIEVTANRSVRAKIARLGLELVGDISHGEHMAIFSVPFRVAKAFGIETIFYGESPQMEYGGPPGSEEALTMTRRWVAEHGGLLGLRPQDFVGMDGITEDDMRDYMMPSDEDLQHVNAFFLGQFIPWDSQRNAEVAIANGMTSGTPSTANWWEFENLDCALTGLHDHAMWRKFGHGRMASQLSVDIRNGRITRERAMVHVASSDGRFPYVYAGVPIEEVLRWLERDMGWLIENLDAHTDWSLFSHVEDHRPILKEVAAEAAE